MGDRLKAFVAVHILFFNGKGEVLLAQRANTGYMDGYYSVPAGHVDEHENAIQSAVREVTEEVGVKVRPEDLEYLSTFHRKSEDLQERIDFFFKVVEWDGEIKNCEPEKCSEIIWVNPGKIPTKTIPYVKKGIEIANKPGSLVMFGWE